MQNNRTAPLDISVLWNRLPVYMFHLRFPDLCKNMEIKNKDGEKGNLKSGMAAQAKIVVDDDSVLHFVLDKINLVD